MKVLVSSIFSLSAALPASAGTPKYDEDLGCWPISVERDATYCIDGPVCSGGEARRLPDPRALSKVMWRSPTVTRMSLATVSATTASCQSTPSVSLNYVQDLWYELSQDVSAGVPGGSSSLVPVTTGNPLGSVSNNSMHA
uniref:Uncharacterized protein n=1 Tax=Peronospora matthiolae TaxID=2874970 RepID=A0AAV1UAE5_9STRA